MDFIWFVGQANNKIVILLKDSHLYVQVEEFYVYSPEWMRRNYTNYLPILICINYVLATAQVYIFNFELV
jgi:hypothetical protein